MKKLPIDVLLAFLTGIAFLTILLVIALAIPYPTRFQLLVFRVILALAAAGLGAVIPGFINIDLAFAAKTAIRAGGAIALFVIIYFFNPAEYAVQGVNLGRGIATKIHDNVVQVFWPKAKVSFTYPSDGWRLDDSGVQEGFGDLKLVSTKHESEEIQFHVSVLDTKYQGNWANFETNTTELWKNALSQFGPVQVAPAKIGGRAGFEIRATLRGEKGKPKHVVISYVPADEKELFEAHYTANADTADETVYRTIRDSIVFGNSE